MISRRQIIRSNQVEEPRTRGAERATTTAASPQRQPAKSKQQSAVSGEASPRHAPTFRSPQDLADKRRLDAGQLAALSDERPAKRATDREESATRRAQQQPFYRDYHHHLLDDALSMQDSESGGPTRGAFANERQDYRPTRLERVLKGAETGAYQPEDQDIDDERDGSRNLSAARPAGAASAAAHDDYQNFDPYSIYAEYDDEEEDVWYSEERLFEDHVQEIIDKWHAIDDEIWAKIICMERNRRTAKAYARRHQLSVDGSEDDYTDGSTLGLNAFENPDRDARTSHIMQYIAQGIRIKINNEGDIYVKRLSRANVFVHKLKSTATRRLEPRAGQLKSSLSNSDVYALNSEANNSDFYGVAGLERPSARLQSRELEAAGHRKQSGPTRFARLQNFALRDKSGETGKQQQTALSMSTSFSSGLAHVDGKDKPTSGHRQPIGDGAESRPTAECIKQSQLVAWDRSMKVFDMKHFKAQLELESQKLCPDRLRLRNMCILVVSFVLDDDKLLNLPSWIIVINIVALDMLRTEIGLMDVRDTLLINRSGHKRGFQYGSYSQLNSSNYNDGYELADEDDVPLESSVEQGDRLIKNKQQLAASKRAFANAAALGAYNGDYYRSPEANGENYFKSRQKLLHLGERSSNIKQSSSSSGFDSHCSSQNDSSAASSRSNIAPNKEGVDHRVISKKGDSPSGCDAAPEPSDKIKAASSCSGLDLCPSSSPPVLPPIPPPKGGNRGKRPPKLPHGVSYPAKSNEQSPGTVSWPIPIPAPPTSATGPSGKANLILVSPTGLSPTQSAENLNSNGSQQEPENTSTSMSSSEGQVPKFNSIKYIDENGQCKVLMNHQRKPLQHTKKLPAGIPSHAQLAPPATQKHILRYLMSAAAGATAAVPTDPENLKSHNKLVANTDNPNLGQHQPPVKCNNRCVILNRPLPVLPPIAAGGDCRCRQPAAASAFAQQKPLRPARGPHLFAPLVARIPDESLYYRGLQARVINPRNQIQQRQHAAIALRQQQLHSMVSSATNVNNNKQRGDFKNTRENLFSSLQKKSRAFYSLWQISS